MTTLAELTTPMTRSEVEAAIYSALATRGVTTTTWKPGAVVRTIIAGVSVVLAAFSSLQALIARGGFLELAEGDWLTLVAQYVYNVPRDQGAFATGNITFNNSGGGVYTGGPDDLIVTNAATGKSYRNTASFSIGALATGVLIPFQAVESGSASTSSAGTITTLTTPLIGVTCTNAAALVGSDPETDEILRIRCREKTGAASPNGPQDAYAYFARSAVRADGTSIGVTRVKVNRDGYGNVTVAVATASGGVTGTSGNPATDLGAIHDSLQRHATPIAVTESTITATSTTVAVTYELWVRDSISMTSAQIQAAVTARLTAFLSSQPIGGEVIPPATTGSLYVSALRAIIGAAVADSLVRVDVTVPAADVAIGAYEVPVLGTVTCTAIHLIAEGLA